MVKGGVAANYSNSLSTKQRKRWTETDDAEDGDVLYNKNVTEERYRSMLGEHIQKFKSRPKDSQGNPTHLMGVPVPNNNAGSYRGRKIGNSHHGRFYDMDTSSNFAADAIPQRRRSNHDSYIIPKIAYEPWYFDIGDGVNYKIPPSYDKLVASLNLPSFSDIQVEDFYLKGTLELRSLAELMASNKRSEVRSRNGMGEPRPQYESIQAINVTTKIEFSCNLRQKSQTKVT